MNKHQLLICSISGLFFCLTGDFNGQAEGQSERSLVDNNLEVQVVAAGISRPTGMAFLGPNDLLVLEQYNGTVLRAKDGRILPTPLLDVNVGNSSERGLLGIEIMPQESGHPFVFLYYTEAESKDGGTILGNRLYRYTFFDDINGGKLTNKTLLLDLPGTPDLPGPGAEHNGGKLAIGPDGNVYVTIGDVRRKTKTQNLMNGADADGSGGILRITPDGEVVGNGILGSTHPIDKYLAYGIRNSFGIDFDPVTGFLWDTENGSWGYDEINFVEPGFNSGWQSVIGFIENDTALWPPNSQEQLLAEAGIHIISAVHDVISNKTGVVDRELVVARDQLEQVLEKAMLLYSFNGRGIYSDPEFVWIQSVAPTAIQFYNSSQLGEKYLNRMFVGEFQTGKILNFALNDSRTGLDLDGSLSDNVASTWDETGPVLFGTGFAGITDIEEGPDGFLYILEFSTGTISRIIPKINN